MCLPVSELVASILCRCQRGSSPPPSLVMSSVVRAPTSGAAKVNVSTWKEGRKGQTCSDYGGQKYDTQGKTCPKPKTQNPKPYALIKHGRMPDGKICNVRPLGKAERQNTVTF